MLEKFRNISNFEKLGKNNIDLDNYSGVSDGFLQNLLQILIHVHILRQNIYIYIYRERERGGERKRERERERVRIKWK